MFISVHTFKTLQCTLLRHPRETIIKLSHKINECTLVRHLISCLHGVINHIRNTHAGYLQCNLFAYYVGLHTKLQKLTKHVISSQMWSSLSHLLVLWGPIFIYHLSNNGFYVGLGCLRSVHFMILVHTCKAS